MTLATHKCPFCGETYLRTDSILAIEKLREYYQEHLNNYCKPSFQYSMKKILMAPLKLMREGI